MSATLALLLCHASPALAADANAPHPHQGVLEAITGAPPRVELSPAELAILERGEPVHKQAQRATGDGAAGRGVAVQDIHADVDTVWGRILDYGAYPDMVDNVKSTDVYERSGDHIKVHFVIGAPMVSIEYWIDHKVDREAGWMTWTLDYDKFSDFDDSVGFWRVEALPERPGWTRVTYSAEVQAAGWVPAPIEKAFSTMGLKKATVWVKRESEARASSAG